MIEDGFSCPADAPNLSVRAPLGVCSGAPGALPGARFDRNDESVRPEQPTLYEGSCAQDTACGSGEVCNTRVCVSQVSCVADADCESG